MRLGIKIYIRLLVCSGVNDSSRFVTKSMRCGRGKAALGTVPILRPRQARAVIPGTVPVAALLAIV